MSVQLFYNYFVKFEKKDENWKLLQNPLDSILELQVSDFIWQMANNV